MRKVLQITTDSETNVLDLDAPEGSLAVLQGAVGGNIECVDFRAFDMYVNEDGKFDGSEFNRFATRLFREAFGPVDLVMGNVVIVGPVNRNGDSTGLSDDAIALLIATVRAAG